MRLRNVLIATTTLVAGTIVGATTQHFASADVTSGDRPVLVSIETCRIADTRSAPNTVGPKSSPLAAADTMTVDAQQAGTDCTGKIPATATALSLNVTALNATSNSFITIWPTGPRPTASALNPAPGQRVFNAVTTELAPDQTFQIYNDLGNVNIIVDINGYYDNHIHDDLYYTEAETDAALALKANTADVPEVHYAVVSTGGAIVRSSPGVSITGGPPNVYRLTFSRDVTSCVWSATLGGDQFLDSLLPVLNDLGISASQNYDGFAVDPDGLLVAVYDAGGAYVASAFTLTVICP